jgi:NADPH-dependent curcumin reductase CurA
MRNRRYVLASRPTGIPSPDNFRLEEVEVPALADGEVLLENRVFALEPAVRGMLDEGKSYVPAVAIGGRIPTMVLGRVVQSRNPKFREGDYGRALIGWEEYSVVSAEDIAFAFENVAIDADIPLTAYMGALGWSGITAYVGLKRHGAMREGDEVLVSAAAGAVGSVAGQIARLSGCRTAGIVGSADKAATVTGALGLDAAIDYRAEPDLEAAIRHVFPDGIDLYFDNVGGTILDTVLPLMRPFGRIPVCGMIANYNRQNDPVPIRNLWQLLVNRITMQGFLAYEAIDMLDEAVSQLAAWLRAGQLAATENVATGIESLPSAFIRLMAGETSGKTLVRLDESVSTFASWHGGGSARPSFVFT